MTTDLQGFPDGATSVNLSDGSASVVVDQAVYPLSAIYGASYVFIDRCFVLIDRPADAQVRVTLTARNLETCTEANLRHHVGEFLNELLSCAWRHQINQENRGVIEAVTVRAITRSAGPPSLDDLEEFDFTDEPFEDPLGIAMSWEDKYTKKKTETPDGDDSDKSE